LENLGDYKLARVIKENRTIPIQDGKFTDDYAPFDVHIYELEKDIGYLNQ